MDNFSYYRTHILFIPGIFPDDCKDDSEEEMDIAQVEMVSEKIQSEENMDFEPYSDSGDEINETQIITGKITDFDLIPKVFKSGKEWIKSVNVLCSYCHDEISGIPFPLPLNRRKELDKLMVPELIQAYVPKKKIKENDEPLIISSQTNREIRVFDLHDIVFCDSICAGNYARKVLDYKIINKRETIKMILMIHKEIYDEEIKDIPDKDLWVIMKQYSGKTGKTRNEYKNIIIKKISN